MHRSHHSQHQPKSRLKHTSIPSASSSTSSSPLRFLPLFLVLLLRLKVCVSFSLPVLAAAATPVITSSSLSASTTTVSSSSSDSTPTKTMVDIPWQQIPKSETQVMELLAKYPKADGRGVRMAIMDTGCDLAARGMEKTSDGKPKYLDFIDCTGDGDVDMTTQVEVQVKKNESNETESVTVTGVSGKKLILPTSILKDAVLDKTDKNEKDKDELPKVRLGCMPLYHILPKTALRRVQNERNIQFTRTQNARLAKAQQDLDTLRKKQASSSSADKKKDKTDDDKTDDNKNNATKKEEEADAEKGDDNKDMKAAKSATAKSLKKQIQETELLMEQLQDMMKDYNDAGPIMDIVLYQTKKGDDDTEEMEWQALVDIDATGNLTSTKAMAPYACHQQFGTLGFGSHVTFCIQVYEGGNTLSLVCDAGSHGTHVAGIAAANYENDKTVNKEDAAAVLEKLQKDGVAPGAQVLALKIGDVRVASAETGTGLIRGLIAAKRYKCHLVNLSFGEPSWQPDSGRVAQVFDDAVQKWGMTVFTSAGNDGPALSTLGSPGTLSSLITVGAYVSPQMMAAQYATLMDNTSSTGSDTTSDNQQTDDNADSTLPGASYSFSSRGPTPDGSLPDICAPGGAIAPIPRHCLQAVGQKHGTSMASPSACGVAACLLSALKEQGVDIDHLHPNELRRALVNSAVKKPGNGKGSSVLDPFAEGAGLVSVTAALEYALEHHGKPGQDLAYDVKIPSHGNARGIFIRDALQLAGPMTKTVTVQPRIEHSLTKTQEEMDKMLSLELELDLIPSQDWIQCPDRLTLLSAKERGAGQSFSIRLDPTGLPPGAHYATVDGIDSKDPKRGPLFQVPVTVIVPHAIVSAPPFSFAETGNIVQSTKILNADSDDKTLDITTNDNGIDVSMKYDLTPGAPARRFLSVPAQAEWAAIRIRSTTPAAGQTAPHSLILHAVPFARGDLHNTLIQIKKFFSLNEGTERVFYVQVKGGSTLEVCLQLSWLANPSPVSVVTDVEFHSLDVRQPNFFASQAVKISGATEFGRFGVSAPFRPEKIHPKATLTSVHRSIRPKDYKISAASDNDDRDMLPLSDAEINAASEACKEGEDQQPPSNGTLVYKSLLTYSFKIDSKDDATVSVTPRFPSIFQQIYDSPLDSQLWICQDNNGKALGWGSCMHEAAPITLTSKPGVEYTVMLRISHPSRAVLEQVSKDLLLRLAIKLSKELDCPVYSQLDKASTPSVTDDGRQPVQLVQLRRGAQRDLYVTRPTAKLPDWVQPGDVMSGIIKLNQKSDGATVLNLFYDVPPKNDVKDGDKKEDKKDKAKSDSDDEEEKKKKLEEELSESIFKTKLSHLAKLRKAKNSEEIYQSLVDELKAEKPDNLPLLEELLTKAKEGKKPANVSAESDESETKWRALQVSNATDAMKSSNGGPIDEAAIAQYYGCNNPPPDEDDDDDEKKEEAEKTKKEMEERRKAWRLALLAKAGAWSDHVMSTKKSDDSVDQSTATTGGEEEDKSSFDSAVQEMKKWVSAAGDLSTDKEKVRHAVVMARHSIKCQGKPVSALSSLRKARKDLPAEFYKELTEEIVGILEGLDGVEYWRQLIAEDTAERFPKVKPTLN